MLDNQEPLVSIVTLNYNQTGISCRFLESTRKLTYSNYEILMCDMASSSNPAAAILAGNYPKTKLLISEKNLGFAGGNNWGIRQAKGDFIFIVNNDTEVTPRLIDLLLQPFYNHPAVGVTSPKIKFYYRPDTIQYAGFNRMNLFTGRTSAVGEGEKDEGQCNQSGPTNAAHGCAMMIKREVIEKTGLFPEKFFLYYEEWDLSARILKAGYTIWYASDAVIYHKESMTVGKNNPMKVYYHTRNRILYMRRNTDTFHFLVFTLFFMFITAPWSVFRFLVNRQFTHARHFIQGAVWNMYSSSASPV